MDNVGHVVVFNVLADSLLNRSTFTCFFFPCSVCSYSGILVQDVLKRERNVLWIFFFILLFFTQEIRTFWANGLYI